MTDKLITEATGALGWLKLNKPAKLNALDEEMLLSLERHIAVWEEGGTVKVVAVGSTTQRAFCVGADLAVLAGFTEESMRAWETLGNRVLNRLQRTPLITVASITGYALGGGLTLAAACDFRICSENATLAQPEIELGWAPGWGGVARLARLVGPGRARELSLTGRRLTAAEALAWGLAERVVPAGELETAVRDFAESLAARSGPALRGIKALAEEAEHAADGLRARFDSLLNASLLGNDAAQAAIRSFLAKGGSRQTDGE